MKPGASFKKSQQASSQSISVFLQLQSNGQRSGDAEQMMHSFKKYRQEVALRSTGDRSNGDSSLTCGAGSEMGRETRDTGGSAGGRST
eukprot:CAMPEP_0119337596 /NCGR_PEP_ID=MMETSP1333-20130426/94326_1 /TAXON_ID=418940 /ORGANISM="Scyphosphaera apsteinii, Strain RCC1455" /LENGTH=87 /DNA_ID=CAMNT_0007348669 /DNA_START=80 /DNA_END=340 /DNA_ORIENTATION=-